MHRLIIGLGQRVRIPQLAGKSDQRFLVIRGKRTRIGAENKHMGELEPLSSVYGHQTYCVLAFAGL